MFYQIWIRPPLKLSKKSREIITNSSNRQHKGNPKIIQRILQIHEKRVSKDTVQNYRMQEGLKPFHVIDKPLKTQKHIKDRLWLCDWLSEWTKEDFGTFR
jgi:hypothetical protein